MNALGIATGGFTKMTIRVPLESHDKTQPKEAHSAAWSSIAAENQEGVTLAGYKVKSVAQAADDKSVWIIDPLPDRDGLRSGFGIDSKGNGVWSVIKPSEK
jgi:hypothetical protein